MSWQTQENSWLHGRVEDLERQLRRRTVALGVGALAAVVALAGLAVVLLRDPGLPPLAPRSDPVTEALRDPRALTLPTDGDEQQATASQDGDAATVRAALAAAMARIEELEAAGGEYEATIAELRGESQALRERLDVSRQGIERLNALLARAVGVDPGAASPALAEAELSAAAPVPAEAAPDPPAETAGDAPRTVGEDLYITTSAVNLRAEPTTEAAVLAVIDDGELVRRIAGDGEWVQVEHADAFVGVVTGWVYGELVRPAAAQPEGG